MFQTINPIVFPRANIISQAEPRLDRIQPYRMTVSVKPPVPATMQNNWNSHYLHIVQKYMHVSISFKAHFSLQINTLFGFATVKQHLKCANEITKEDTNANVAISKSASTPASLQAVIRFQNGSNMSLQHKVRLPV